MKNLAIAPALALVSLAAFSCSRRTEPEIPPQTIAAPKATEIVATLETPIPKGKNVIWCASFLATWKSLAGQDLGEPIALEESGKLVTFLNAAPDPRANIPKSALYTATGWTQDGIVGKIQKEIAQKFPSKQAPTFPEITANAFIAYSYLEASVSFKIPYFDNHKPLAFTDAEGRKTSICSFGIRSEDDYAYYKLRAQPLVLFRTGTELAIDGIEQKELEFAIDLCPDSKPNQIVIARINREPTLAAAIARVDKESIEMKMLGQKKSVVDYYHRMGPNDVLLVPNLHWLLSHHFSELEGRIFANTKLKGKRLDVAQQDILFRLDKSGAELKSESKMMCLPIPTYFVMDRPFLIYMRQRGSKTPYFALWVDNAELLSKWLTDGSAQDSNTLHE